MSKFAITVAPLGADHLQWGYSDDGPSLSYGEDKWGLNRSVKVDLFPGYGHKLAFAEIALTRVAEKWPLGRNLHLWLSQYEAMGRTNGFSDRLFPYGDKEPQPPEHHIFLSAKRIPIHPAMTRYLVAHEYGHHVQWVLGPLFYPDKRYPFGGGGEEQNLVQEYAKLRDVAPVDYSVGGAWHRCPTEIFANDFRVLITQEELEFWPHDARPPHLVPEVVEWWKRAKEKWFAHIESVNCNE